MIEQTPMAGVWHGLRWRMRHYRAVFGRDDPSVKAVFADLAKYSRFLATTHEAGQSRDDGLILEGRRQMFLRILQHIRLTPAELFTILNGLDDATRVALFDNNRPAPLYEDHQ